MCEYSLVGVNGNAFCVMGYTSKTMRKCGFNNLEITQYYNECKKSDYNHLLSESIKMIDKCNEIKENANVGKN